MALRNPEVQCHAGSHWDEDSTGGHRGPEDLTTTPPSQWPTMSLPDRYSLIFSFSLFLCCSAQVCSAEPVVPLVLHFSNKTCHHFWLAQFLFKAKRTWNTFNYWVISKRNYSITDSPLIKGSRSPGSRTPPTPSKRDWGLWRQGEGSKMGKVPKRIHSLRCLFFLSI